MPTYTFLNTKTDEYEDLLMSYEESKEFEKKNPHMKKQLTTAGFINRTVDSGRLPEGFKDRLREMKRKHPKAGGVDPFI